MAGWLAEGCKARGPAFGEALSPARAASFPHASKSGKLAESAVCWTSRHVNFFFCERHSPTPTTLRPTHNLQTPHLITTATATVHTPIGTKRDQYITAAMAATNGDSNMEDVTSKAPEGTIIPPASLREIIEKTAGYVARNGASFEGGLREKQAGNSKMSFLMEDDAYFAYYRWRMSEIKAGRGNAVSAGRAGEVSFQGREERKGPEPPEEFQFSARVPNISAQDLDVVKLTALFVAKNGRGWMTQLSQREAGNFQFDFLRPQHTLYQFFSRLVDQYQELLTGDSTDGGRPQKKRITTLEQNVKERFQVLDRARKRAEWVKHQEAQKVAKEEQQEKERVEYAQIDWHDFVVVETVVFDERDENADLPAPTTMNDLQSASLEQKAAMSIDPGRRIEEAFPSFDDQSQFYGQQQQQQQQPWGKPSQLLLTIHRSHANISHSIPPSSCSRANATTATIPSHTTTSSTSLSTTSRRQLLSHQHSPARPRPRPRRTRSCPRYWCTHEDPQRLHPTRTATAPNRQHLHLPQLQTGNPQRRIPKPSPHRNALPRMARTIRPRGPPLFNNKPVDHGSRQQPQTSGQPARRRLRPDDWPAHQRRRNCEEETC